MLVLVTSTATNDGSGNEGTPTIATDAGCGMPGMVVTLPELSAQEIESAPPFVATAYSLLTL